MSVAWIVMGSGTAVPHPQRSSAAHVLRGDRVAALVDTGSGCKDGLARCAVPLGEVTHILYSHAHLDHWADLLSLLFYRAVAPRKERREGLTIAGPGHLLDMIRDVAGRIDSDLLSDNADLVWKTFAPGEPLDGGWFDATAHRVDHGRQVAQAIRLRGPGFCLCYSGDTSPCAGLERAARGAETLVCECSFPDGAGRKNHMTPSLVRALADRAGVSRVVLTHLYPEILQTPLPGPAFDGFAGQVMVASDGFCLPLVT